jgi:hypothetical protein
MKGVAKHKPLVKGSIIQRKLYVKRTCRLLPPCRWVTDASYNAANYNIFKERMRCMSAGQQALRLLLPPPSRLLLPTCVRRSRSGACSGCHRCCGTAVCGSGWGAASTQTGCRNSNTGGHISTGVEPGNSVYCVVCRCAVKIQMQCGMGKSGVQELAHYPAKLCIASPGVSCMHALSCLLAAGQGSCRLHRPVAVGAVVSTWAFLALHMHTSNESGNSSTGP